MYKWESEKPVRSSQPLGRDRRISEVGNRAKLVSEQLLRDIVASEWREGEALGTENQLIAEYGISRATFREAVRMLEFQGVVNMQPGIGLKIAAPARTAVTTALRRFIEMSGATDEQVESVRSLLANSVAGDALAEDPVGKPDPCAAPLKRTGSPSEMSTHASLGRAHDFDLARYPIISLLLDALPRRCKPAGRKADSEAAKRLVLTSSYEEDDLDRSGQTADFKKLSDIIARSMASDIVKHPIGERLGTEADMIASGEVGRSTFRQAIFILECIGLVIRKRGYNGGLFRAQPDPSVSINIFKYYNDFMKIGSAHYNAARQPIALKIAELSALNASPDHLAELSKNLKIQKGFGKNNWENGILFHIILTKIVDNPVLLIFSRVLMHGFWKDPHSSLEEAYVDGMYETHLAILQEIIAGDPNGAKQAMEHHLEFANKCLI